MTDIESARTGYTKLYHPRGPLVSLPVTGENPAAMFACVSAMLDAGFVVAAPGLEVGEEREMVSCVLHSNFERDGEVTPTVLLYAANEALEWSFLKVYLNEQADVNAFESACGVKLESLPVYDGTNKPKRDGSVVAKKYITRLPNHVPVVFKQNPKWSEEENAKCIAAQKPYTTPKRVFISWADAPPPSAEPPKPSELDVAVEAWKVRLANVIGVDDLNKTVPIVKAIVDGPIRMRAWTMCLELADSKKWVFDKDKRVFRHAAEMTAPPPPTEAPKAAPPPPDDGVPPLIATWTKKLAGDVLKDFEGSTRQDSERGLAKLNGDILKDFKAIAKSDPQRGDVWVMVVDFANKYGCEFDTTQMKFAETAGSMP